MTTRLITYDWETFYSKDYSLTNMTTEEYVRDPRFEAIGISIKLDHAPAHWFSGSHAEIAAHLRKFDWEGSACLAHNTAFDAAILNYHFGIKPKLHLDTYSMARALVGMETSLSLKALATHYKVGVKGDEVIAAMGKRRADFTPYELAKYGAYCINDGELCYDLFEIMRVGFPKDEIRLIDLTLRMQTEPVLVLDKPLLEKHLKDVVHRKEILLERLSARYGKDVLMSNPKFAAALRDFGIEPPMKTSKTTGKETYAFAKLDEGLKLLTEHENPDVQALVAARLGVKSTQEESRTQRLIGIAERGLLPVPLRFFAAHTGRWGGDGKINLQNLMRGSALKRAIKAPPGYVLVDADSSQIEARTLAWLAGQLDLLEAFEQGEDVYRIMAGDIYGCLPDEASDLQRFVGKTTILSAGFGVAEVRLQAALKNATPSVSLSLEECQEIIHTYRRKNYKITELWWQSNEALKAIATDRTCKLDPMGILKVEGKDGIRLPNGMRLTYPNLRYEPYREDERPSWIYDSKLGKSTRRVKIYGASLVENFTQAVARVVIGEQMLQIAKRYRVALTVHDAICAVVPEAEQAEGMAFVEACMKARPTWALDLPLSCEVGSGASYGDC